MMFARWLFISFILCLIPDPANARTDFVDVRIDLSKQKMDVIVVGYHEYTWDISSARRGYTTPVGDFRVNWISPMHYSEQYDAAPMPHAIFFHEGIAIHGTDEIKHLGRPASHGCVRLSPEHARTLFELVEIYGIGNTRISVKKEQAPVTEPVRGKFPVLFEGPRF